MKHCLLTILIAFSFAGSLSAQTKSKKHPNRFDTTLAKKHEFSVAIGVANGSPYAQTIGGGMGPSLSVAYARVYRANHFLRTGAQIFANSSDIRSTFSLPANALQANPTEPDNYSMITSNAHWQATSSYYGAFVGYEYGVGRKWLRFTFGADLVLGYNHRRLSLTEDTYHITRTLDPNSQLYEYNVKFLQTGQISGISSNIFLGLSHRLGLRADLGKRMALAFTFTPQVGFSQGVGYREIVSNTRPLDYYHPKSTWYLSANAELRLIFKLGKS